MTRLMRKIRKNASAAVVVFLFLAVFSAGAVAEEKKPEEDIKGFYNISCDDPQWKEFKTTDEMRRSVYLDESTFDNVSTEEVLRAVLEYPLIGDILAFSTNELGIEQVSEHCTALRVFLAREDAYDVLNRAISDKEGTVSRVQGTEITKMGVPIVLRELKAYLDLTAAIDTPAERATVYTPNGTGVSVMTLPEMSQADINFANDYYPNAYPSAQYVSTATRKYNCHSYAWHWNSTSNHYWMNNPSAYMSDGSYTRIYTVNSAYKAFYSSANHSANIYDTTGNSFDYAFVISKWGSGPLMIHNIRYGPYGGTITLWA